MWLPGSTACAAVEVVLLYGPSSSNILHTKSYPGMIARDTLNFIANVMQLKSTIDTAHPSSRAYIGMIARVPFDVQESALFAFVRRSTLDGCYEAFYTPTIQPLDFFTQADLQYAPCVRFSDSDELLAHGLSKWVENVFALFTKVQSGTFTAQT